MINKLKIIIDTREQRPFAFPEHLVDVDRGTLTTGDYALKGDTGFAIERKSLSDFVSTLASGYERFLRELERMKEFPAKLIIVEADYMDIINHNYDSPKLQPQFILKRMVDITMDYGACIVFANNALTAAGCCYLHLKKRKLDLE